MRSRGARIWLFLLATFVVASAAAVAVPLIQGVGSTADRPAAAIAVICTQEPDAVRLDPAYCERIATDSVARTWLTAAEREAAQRRSESIRGVLVRQRRTECDPTSLACHFVYLAASPDEVTRALVRAGFPDAIVRIARADDPGPAGRVLYAAPAGPACLLGYFSGSAGEMLRVEGRRADGTCLQP